MSAKTVISSQIQMKNRKNQSIDQKTCPVPKSLASMLGTPTPRKMSAGNVTILRPVRGHRKTAIRRDGTTPPVARIGR
jgi:hypothetical protein